MTIKNPVDGKVRPALAKEGERNLLIAHQKLLLEDTTERQ